MKIQGMIIIILMCGFILLILAMKTRSHLLLNFLLRGLYGSVVIILTNYLFDSMGISLEIGLNPITLLTCMILGFPGLLLVFGINFFMLL